MLAAERLVIEHFVGNPLALHDHVRFVHLGRVSNLRLLSRAFPSLCHSYICPTVGLFINKVLFRKNHMCVNFRQILFSGLREVFRICLNFSKMVLFFGVTTEKLKSASRHLCVVGLPPLYFDHPSPLPLLGMFLTPSLVHFGLGRNSMKNVSGLLLFRFTNSGQSKPFLGSV